MIQISDDLKTQLSTSTSIKVKNKIVVGTTEYDGSVIKTYPKMSHSNASVFGGFPAKTCSFEIYNRNNNIDLENKELKIYKGIEVNGSTEWILQGIFIPRAKDIETNITSKTISFNNIQDKTQNFDIPYESNLSWDNNATHTGLEIMQEICTKLSIELESNSFNLSSYNFKQPNFTENITYREVVNRFAEIAGCIAFISRSGKLVIKAPTNVNYTIERNRYIKLTKETKVTFNTLVLGKENINDDIIYPETITTDRVEYKILDNPFVDLYREDMIEDISANIIGKSYIPFTLNNFVDGFCLDLNDTISVKDRDGNTLALTILNYEVANRISVNTSADTMGTTPTDYNLAGSSKAELKEVKLNVDHINQSITALAKKTDETSEKMSEIEQTVDGITSTVSTITIEVDNTVKSISKQYKIKDSTDDWSDTYPTRQEGQVILAREKYVHTDDTITYGTEYEITGDKGDDGIDGTDGKDGKDGVDGKDGTTYYTWVKYADSPTSGMSDIPTDKKYIGFAYNKTTATESTNYSDYSWSLIKGEKGDQGEQGIQGEKGETVAQGIQGEKGETGAKGETGEKGDTGASGADGNGISNIAYYYATSTTQIAPAASSITSTTMPTLSATNKYLWQKEVITFTETSTPQTTVLLIAVYGDKGDTGAQGEKGDKGDKGEQGIQGPAGADGTSQYFFVRYSENSTGNPMTTAPTSATKYMGVANTTSSTAPTSYTDYTWSLIKGNDGKDGTDGTPGATGADGKTAYLHIMYSVDGKDFAPETEEYAKGKNPSAWRGEYVDFNETDSTEFSDYTWYKLTESIDGRLDSIEQDIADTNKNYKTYTDNEVGKLNEKFADYATNEVVTQVKSEVSTALTNSQYAINVSNEIIENGVSKLKTSKGFTFDDNGLGINSDDSKTSFNADTDGIEVIEKSSNTTLLYAGYDSTLKRSVVNTDNIEVDNYILTGNVFRQEIIEDETYGKGIGFFFVGGD